MPQSFFCFRTHNKQLDELQFAQCVCRCILEGMSSHPMLSIKYPTVTAKLSAVFIKMGFDNRKELRAVMHARGFGLPVSSSLAAGILAEAKSGAAQPLKPPAHPGSRHSVHAIGSSGRSAASSIAPARRSYNRRGSAEARMRLITTPGSDLVSEVMATP